MKKVLLAVAVLLVASVSTASVPVAQELQAGNWTGTVAAPDGVVIDAVFVVTNTDDVLGIAIQIPEVGVTLETIEPKLEGVELTFEIAMDTDFISCTLRRDDEGAYGGDCVDQDGGTGHMMMTPPTGS